MCGIAGFAGPDAPSSERLGRMCAAMRHRGPDDEGHYLAPGIALGMRRLAVLDLETGGQPVASESGEVQAVFNGEIYNFRELRSELLARGCRLHGTGDSELIPHLYAIHGRAFLERLNGMFAIALWDARSRTLLLARDRLGIKPLFWSERAGHLYFGSELKCILAAGGSSGSLDLDGIDQLLSLEYTLSPQTLLADVHKLPPGCLLTWTQGRARIERWWHGLEMPHATVQHSIPEWSERLRSTLLAAVRRQVVADVPLGAFLSGGIDSSILVAAMAQVSAQPPLTFSVGFEGSGYDELAHARRVAAHCHTQHTERILSPDYAALLPEVVGQLDQPIADFSVFPTLLVARMARERVTVALGGDGGDELFAGYDTYAAQQLSARFLDWLPQGVRARLARGAARVPLGAAKRGVGNQLRRFLEGSALPSDLQHLRWMTFVAEPLRAELYRPGLREAVRGALERRCREALEAGMPVRAGAGADAGAALDAQTRCDLRLYLPENILQKVDAMSMACSLEARVPYLDNEVVDLALQIPPALKARHGVRKWILRQAFAADLPAPTLARGKEGFSMPMKHWLNGPFNKLMHELLAAGSLARDGLFDARCVARLIREHEHSTQNHSHVLWALMVFQLWRERFAVRRDEPAAHAA